MKQFTKLHIQAPKQQLLAAIIGRIAILVPQLFLEAQFRFWTFKTAVLVLKLYF